MDSGLYRVVGAMNGAQRSLDTHAHNLANLGTHGYKRRAASATLFQAATEHGLARGIGTETAVDWTQGDLERTGSPFHLALEGEGFFAAESPEGEVYTRYGGFTFDGNGVLTTVDGLPLAWAERYTAFDASGEPPVVDGEGQVYQGPTLIGRLKLAAFDRPQELRELPGGYWQAPAGLRAVTVAARIQQGSLERSNTTGVNELIDMLETQRAFEVAARTVSSIDHSYQRLTAPRG
jgi:flagellar basal-body rod protein FlgF